MFRDTATVRRGDHRPFAWAMIIASAILSCGLAAQPSAAQAVEPAQLIPDIAVVYAEVSDTEALLSRALDERLHSLLSRAPQVQAYYGSDAYRKVQFVVSLIEGQVGTSWKDLVRQIASVHFAADGPGNALLILRAEDAAVLRKFHDSIQQLVEADAANRGDSNRVQSSDYRGHAVQSFGPNQSHALIDDLLIVSNRSEGVHAAIDRLLDESATTSLGDAEDFQEARGMVASDQAGWAMVRLDAVRRLPQVAAALEAKSDNPVIELVAGGVLEVLRSAPFAVASLQVSADTLGLRVQMPRGDAAVREQRAWYFPADPAQAAGAPLLPSNALATLTFYRDIAGLWQHRDELFQEGMAANLAQIDSQLGLFFSGRDFGTEVLGQLAPRTQLVVARQDFATEGEAPAIKLPAFALVLGLRDEDAAQADDLAQSLLVTFQKFVGIYNLVGGMNGQPQMLLASEEYEGVQISKGTYLDSRQTNDQAALNYNFSPACARVGDHFIYASTVGMLHDLIDSLHQPMAAAPSPEQTLLAVDLAQLADVLDDNRESLISQNMLAQGHDRESAERDIGLLLELLRSLHHGQIRLSAGADVFTFETTLKSAP